LSTVLLWIKIAALLWSGALGVVLLSEIRFFQRLMPDWLRNLARLFVLVGTVGALTMALLFGVKIMSNSFAARTGTGGGATIDLCFKSPGCFARSAYLSWHQSELNQPASDDPSEVSFAVESGETAAGVAARLEQQGLVVNGEVFRRFMTYKGLDTSLEAGTYLLRANMTMHEIAEALQHGGGDAVTVTIPEGWRAEQVAWLLEQQGLMRSDDFMAEVRSGQYDYPWLACRTPGTSLEGFLFPDTYQLEKDAKPADVVRLMLARFDDHVAPQIDSRLPGKMIFDLNQGTDRPMTACDVMILASIVEREAVVAEERPIIAGVYFNRLNPAYINEAALRLSADPTVQYAKGFDPTTENWWNPMLPGEGQTIESPYNTFIAQGLPPGPICSPGLASVLAALEPAQTNYLYFFAIGDGSGKHAFAATLEEHLSNQEKYKP
jgi:UPF0755 protein